VVDEPGSRVVGVAESNDLRAGFTVVVPPSTASGTQAATKTTITADFKMPEDLTQSNCAGKV
jgi:hypothetical protein